MNTVTLLGIKSFLRFKQIQVPNSKGQTFPSVLLLVPLWSYWEHITHVLITRVSRTCSVVISTNITGLAKTPYKLKGLCCDWWAWCPTGVCMWYTTYHAFNITVMALFGFTLVWSISTLRIAIDQSRKTHAKGVQHYNYVTRCTISYAQRQYCETRHLLKYKN